jgi:RHS repeat-associated protein
MPTTSWNRAIQMAILVLICFLGSSAVGFCQGTLTVASVSLSPSTVVGASVTAMATVTFNEPAPDQNFEYDLVAYDPQGAPLGGNGSGGCGWGIIYTNVLQGATSSTFSVGPACSDLISGSYPLKFYILYGNNTQSAPVFQTLTLQAAQYTASISPTTLPFGTTATATLTRSPGFGAGNSKFYYVDLGENGNCGNSQDMNTIGLVFGGTGAQGLTLTNTTGSNTFQSSRSYLPGDMTCTMTFHETNGSLDNPPYETIAQIPVTFKAKLDEIDLGPNVPCVGTCGMPINLTNGNTWLQADEYELPGLGGISLKRAWNSQWANNSPLIQAGMFGDSWQSSFEKNIQVLSGGKTLRYWRGDGSAWLFTLANKVWTLTSPVDERATLTSSRTGYTVSLRDGGVELYNTNGNLTALKDRNGNQTTVTYDGSTYNRISKVTSAAGQILQFNYANSILPKQVSSIQDSVGTVATYTYDTGSHLLSVTYADGQVINYGYDTNGLLLSVTDQQGKVLESHTYDPSSRQGLTSVRANGIDSVTVSYNVTQALLNDSLGNATTYAAGTQIGNRRYLTSIQGTGCDSCGGRSNQTFVYDGSGNRASSQDANGNKTTFQYDANGNITQTSLTIGTSTQVRKYTWNSFREPLTVTDPLSKVTTYTYDTNGNLLTVKTPMSETTTYGYDTKGELTSIKDPRLNVTTITYNSAGLITSIKDPQNNLTQYQYDARGNKTSVTDPLNQITSYAYDARNRLTKITYPTSPATTTQFGYDYRGRRTSVTDANTKLTQYAYDDADRVVSVTDANNNITGYTYDTESNLTKITDAATHATSFNYDALGRVTLTTFPVGTESYGYDSNGTLTSKIDRKNQTISYVYDAANRLTSKSYPDTTSVAYTYDLANHLTQVSDPTGTYGFTLDADGRLTQASTTYSFISGHVFNVGYGYDAASNRTSMTDPQNGGTTYVYDTLNRLSSLTSPQGAFGFSYDALGRRTQLTRPNGVATTYGYDPVSRLLSVLHKLGNTVFDGTGYTVDAVGNRTSKTDQSTGVASNYTYDPVYQLTQVVQGVSTTESYSFDAVGNRLSSLGGSPYVYNSSNELTSDPSASFTYDNNGNPLTKTDTSGTTTYTWDFENRLTSVALPGTAGTVTFKYDPQGRRIQKSSPSGTTNYLYDGNNLLEEIDSSGNVLARYTQGLVIDEPFAMLRGGATSFYEADGLGSITSLSNSAGALANTYSYDSFGKVTASTGTVTNPLQYTAREFDTETSLNYYRARYYDSVTGRFLSEDPPRSGVNYYRYVNNSPTNGKDASGLWDADTHSKLIWNALAPCGVEHDIIYEIQQESDVWDKATGLNSFFANAHSMAAPGQSAADAIQGRSDFIESQLQLANWAWNHSKDYYWVNFTHAVHAMMDSTSPAHVDPSGNPYTWPSFPNALEHGTPPWIPNPFDMENWAHMTPGLMQKNISMIRKAWTTVTGQNCGCNNVD